MSVRNDRPAGIPVLSTAERTLLRLLDGNERFVRDHRQVHLPLSSESHGLHHPHAPVAAVLTCVDARVSPDHIFDAPLGQLLTLRTPAHVLDSPTLAGLQLAVQKLSVPLVVVMSHDECAAVAGVCAHRRGEEQLTGALSQLPDHMQVPADADLSVESATSAHLRDTCQRLAQEPDLRAEVESGTVRIVGAHLSIPTGRVHIEC